MVKIVDIGGKDMNLISSILLIVIMGLCVGAFYSFSILQYNEYGVEKEFGKLSEKVSDEGFVYVGIGELKRINNQIRTYEIKVESFSKDFQIVNIDLILNIRIKKDEVANFLRSYNTEQIYNQYLTKKVQEKVKTIVLKNNAEGILQARENISKEMSTELSKLPELKFFEFNDVVIKNIAFSEKFQEILERKAQVEIEREIIKKEKENNELLKKNIDVLDIHSYFLYQIANKWDGQADLIIGGSLIRKEVESNN